MQPPTNNTRHEVIHLLESVVDVVREQDDRLDGMRSAASESLQMTLGTFRGEGERITDNMIE
eukprot:11469999-Karenia_brevis.AAC.1